jgi:hypothetical protein
MAASRCAPQKRQHLLHITYIFQERANLLLKKKKKEKKKRRMALSIPRASLYCTFLGVVIFCLITSYAHIHLLCK